VSRKWTGTDDREHPTPTIRSDLPRSPAGLREERSAAEAASPSILDKVRLRRGQVTLPATCSVADLCTLLIDLTPRSVEQLANEGVLVKAEAGCYDLVRSVRGYIAYREYILAKDRQGAAADREAVAADREAVAADREAVAADREAAARRFLQTVP
jgi:hypothetical protein